MVALSPAAVLSSLKMALQIVTVGVSIKRKISELGIGRVGTPSKSVQSLVTNVPKEEAVDLAKLFKSNKVAAKTDYQDRIAIVSGRLASVSATRRQYKIRLVAGISQEVDCLIGKSRIPLEEIIELQVGQPMHILGVVKGKALFSGFRMEHCTIAE